MRELISVMLFAVIIVSGVLFAGFSDKSTNQEPSQETCSAFTYPEDCKLKCGCHFCYYYGNKGTCYSTNNVKYCSTKNIDTTPAPECKAIETKYKSYQDISATLFFSSFMLVVLINIC